MLQKIEEVSRLKSEREELLVQIEAGEGANTAIQQLSQEKVCLDRNSIAFSVSMSACS
jgi:hypothetical protein